MRTEIKELHQRLKTTTIYVTHDQIEAMTMADRIVVMRDGSIEQVGGPIELYDRPENIFVAGFIGSPAMNFIAGEITANGAFRTAGGTTFAVGPAARMPPARPIGIRPEDITRPGQSGHERTLPISFKVRVIEPTGSEVQVIGTFDGAESSRC